MPIIQLLKNVSLGSWNRLRRKVFSESYAISSNGLFDANNLMKNGLSLIQPIPGSKNSVGTPIYGSVADYGSLSELKFNISTSNLAASCGRNFAGYDSLREYRLNFANSHLYQENAATIPDVQDFEKFVSDRQKRVYAIGFFFAVGSCAAVLPVVYAYGPELLSLARFGAASRGPVRYMQHYNFGL